jgi:hypothetical protein
MSKQPFLGPWGVIILMVVLAYPIVYLYLYFLDF